MGYRTTKTNHKVKVHKTVSCRIDFFYYAFRNVLLVSVPLLIFSIFVFTIPHSSAEISSGTDNVQLVLSTSCTVNAVVTEAHETSLHGGQKDDNVGNTKLSAFCNDNNGYSIYAVGSSGDIDGNTDLINTVNESYNIRTGVYDSNNVANPSSWAMKLTAGTGTGIDPVTGESVPTTPPTILNGYDNYSAIPNVYTQVAKRTSGTSMITDSDASGSYLNTTYQIYANSYQPAGTYNGKVKYIIVHPNSNNNYLGFNEAFAANGKKPAIIDGANAYYAMQDMTTDICNSVSRNGESTSTQLVDTRDNNLYWVTKLKDGHCWMTENLDIDINSSISFNSNNTDLNVAYDSSTGQYMEYSDGYAESNGIIYWKPASSANTIDFTGTTVPGWRDSNTTPYTANKTDSTETGHNSLGNYYNWTAAIASNNSSSISADNTRVTNSICPKGWRLPNVVDNEFGILNNIYNNGSTSSNSNLMIAPLWFIKSGNTNSGKLNFLWSNGYYWTSNSIGNTNIANNLRLIDNNVYPNYTNNDYTKDTGFSVRCLAR